MHPPGGLEEVTELGRQHGLVADQPAQGGRVDRVGVGALRDLRELLRVAEQQQPVAGHRAGEGLRERELARLVDDHEVELPAPDPLGVGEVPRRAADDVAAAGPHVAGGESRQVVGPLEHGPGGALGVARRLADPGGRHPGRDHGAQHVLDRLVPLRGDAHRPAVLEHEARDDARGDVGLAGAGRPLDGQVGVVGGEQGGLDGVEVPCRTGAQGRQRSVFAEPRQPPGQQVDAGRARQLVAGVDHRAGRPRRGRRRSAGCSARRTAPGRPAGRRDHHRPWGCSSSTRRVWCSRPLSASRSCASRIATVAEDLALAWPGSVTTPGGRRVGVGRAHAVAGRRRDAAHRLALQA